MKSLFPSHMGLTEKVMDMQLMRQNVVASNLANLTTPNYKARNLEFEDNLQAALNLDARGKMTRSDQKHIPAAFHAETFGPDMEKGMAYRVIHGDDTVDLDKEMATMAKNTMRYNALTTVLKRGFDGLRDIMTGA
ncbi:MAG: flagellar basal body rod protein FlgB [Thermodesulfobacteriota bacterium]